MARKPAVAVSNRYPERMLETQRQLRDCFRYWKNTWPGTIRWPRSAANDEKWWDLTAALCLDLEVPSSLMIYIGYAYANMRAEDAAVPFSASTYRSDALMRRALANFRSVLGISLKAFEPLWLLENRKELVMPGGLLSAARLVAELSCQYFELAVRVALWSLTRGKYTAPEVVHDNLAYELCQSNPYLLLRVAKTPRLRSLAAVNCFLLSGSQPWNHEIWEGIPKPDSLMNPHAAAGGNVAVFYADGRLQKAWPLFPFHPAPYGGLNDETEAPALLLGQHRTCGKTDLFLATKLRSARLGGGSE